MGLVERPYGRKEEFSLFLGNILIVERDSGLSAIEIHPLLCSNASVKSHHRYTKGNVKSWLFVLLQTCLVLYVNVIVSHQLDQYL